MSTFPAAARLLEETGLVSSRSTVRVTNSRHRVQEVNNQPHYDSRIDFFRGLSLVFIFINHIPSNAFSYFTFRTVALFDSAEVFMFLAGYSAALGYYSLVPQGLQAFSRKALRRAGTILLYQIGLVILVMSAAFALVSAGIKTDYEVFLDELASEPLQAIVGIPTLAFQAPLLDILPMYIVVMLLAPFLIWLRAQGEVALMTVSGMVWMFAARFFPAIPTVTYQINWFFNPFCWQFLFAIGLIFGWRTRTNMPPVASGMSRCVLDLCSLLFVVFSACVLMTIAFESITDPASNRLRAMYYSLNKQTLDLWRVVGLLASSHLAARLISKSTPWLLTKPAGWVCAAGSFSLPIFSFTVVLSFAGKFLVMAFGPDQRILADAIVTASGTAILLLSAHLLKTGQLQQSIEAVIPAGSHWAAARQRG